jgi:transposase-like protein
MSQNQLPPPTVEACLIRPRQSTQKGGTIIAEEVMDRATHEQRICDPNGYRPKLCLRCGNWLFHVHDYRERRLRADPGQPVTKLVRHICVACKSIWQVLPGFIARHLWRTWRVVAYALMPNQRGRPSSGQPRGAKVPARTVRRWRERWQRPAQSLRQILAASGEAAWAELATRLQPAATCADLVAAYGSDDGGQALAALAALLYRLQPKVRLM